VKRRIRISNTAAAQIDAASAWWRKHRDKAPDAFDEDLDDALQILRAEPGIGSPVRARRAGVRRLWLDRIRYFVYYREAEPDIIEVLAVWHGSRRSGPRL
jgi:plasmid stabilization system protein ParE